MSFVTCSRKISIDLITCALVLWALLWPVTTAWAGGRYQRTKDGKTLVWNDEPRPGDVPAWSGNRERDGYATGFGTLTWYKSQDRSGESRQTLYAYYFGNMVRGKFNGPVNGHSRGLTSHAIFMDGRRTTRWIAGSTPSWKIPQPVAPSGVGNLEEVAIAKASRGEPGGFNPPPPSYAGAVIDRPVPDFSRLHESPADVPAEGPGSVQKGRGGSAGENARESHLPQLDIDDSLVALTGPPSSLKPHVDVSETKPNASPSSSGSVQLSKQEVIDLADAEMRKRGHKVEEYQRPEPLFDPVDRTWSLFYERNPGSGEKQTNKHFTVAIDDKTRRIAIVPAR